MKIQTIILLSILSLSAQSLDSLIERAIDRSQTIVELKQIREATVQKVSINGKIPDLVLSGGYYIRSVETKVGPQKGKVALSQTIPWPGAISAKKDVARTQVTVVDNRIVLEMNNLTDQIKRVWNNLYLIHQSITIKEKSLKLLSTEEEIITTMYSSNRMPQSSILKIEVEKAKLEDEIESLQSGAIAQREKLASRVNNHINTAFWPDSLSPLPLIKSQEIDSIVTRSPSIQLLMTKSDVIHNQIRVSKNSFAPNITIRTDYIFTDSINNPSLPSGENGKDAWIIGGAISLPIWAKSRRAGVNQQRANLSAITSTINQKILDIKAEIAT